MTHSSTNLSADDSSHSASLGSCATRSFWHNSAPDRVREAQRSGDGEVVWSAWSAYLAKRKKPRRPDRLFSTRRSPLLWALPEGADSQAIVELIERLAVVESADARPGSLDEAASRWMADAAGSRRDFGYAVEAVAWAGAMCAVAGHLSSAVWWRLLDHLVAAASEAAGWPVEESPLDQQMLAGEVALTLAYSLPEITACRRLGRAARESLSAGLVESLDGQGLPRAEHMWLLRPLLACWTRCQVLGRHMKKGCFDRGVAGQFDWVVREVLRWTRADGSPVLDLSLGLLSAEMVATAIDFDRDRDDRRVAAVVLGGGRKRDGRRAGRGDLPEPAVNSEWSRAAVLRGDWSHRGASVSVLYPDKEDGERASFLTEVSVRGEVFWSGPWECEIRRDGQVIALAGDWDETCWVSDEDVDYLELEIELADGMRIERQMILAHKDRLLLVADAIFGDRSGRLEYRGRLPLWPGVSAADVPETREVVLTGRRAAAMAIPLALGEWRADDGAGSLAGASDGLEWRQTAEGRAMYCPVLFDFDPRRFDRPRTWRQLTVAESLTIRPADVAVGYRVQIGRQQWLIYRSLAERANRTLLGHNLSSESLWARFDRKGEVTSLVEVE